VHLILVQTFMGNTGSRAADGKRGKNCGSALTDSVELLQLSHRVSLHPMDSAAAMQPAEANPTTLP